MKYIVIWYLLVWSVGGIEIKENEYTGAYPESVPAIAKFYKDYRLQTKEFDTRKEAEKYIEKAPDFIKYEMKIVELKIIETGNIPPKFKEPHK